MLSNFIVGVLLTLATPEQDPKALLDLLVATQASTAKELEKLSYEVDSTYTRYLNDDIEPTSVNMNLRLFKKSNSAMLIWKTDVIFFEDDSENNGRTGTKVYEEKGTRVRVILRTGEYLAVWSDIAKPDVRLFFYDEWKNSGKDVDAEFGHALTTMNIQQACLGLDTQFSEIYSKNLHKWAIHEFDPLHVIRISGSRPVDGIMVEFLSAKFRPKDGLMTEWVSRPSTPIAQSAKVEYSEFASATGKIGVPIRHIVTRLRKDGRAPITKDKKFSNFQDLSMERPLELADMELPQQAVLNRIAPDGTVQSQVWNGRSLDTIEWSKSK